MGESKMVSYIILFAPLQIVSQYVPCFDAQK